MLLAQVRAVLELVAEVLDGQNPAFDLVDANELTEECLSELSRSASSGPALAEAHRHVILMLDGLKNQDSVYAAMKARRAVNEIDRHYRLQALETPDV